MTKTIAITEITTMAIKRATCLQRWTLMTLIQSITDYFDKVKNDMH
jgi:hypothetical protein